MRGTWYIRLYNTHGYWLYPGGFSTLQIFAHLDQLIYILLQDRNPPLRRGLRQDGVGRGVVPTPPFIKDLEVHRSHAESA